MARLVLTAKTLTLGNRTHQVSKIVEVSRERIAPSAASAGATVILLLLGLILIASRSWVFVAIGVVVLLVGLRRTSTLLGGSDRVAVNLETTAHVEVLFVTTDRVLVDTVIDGIVAAMNAGDSFEPRSWTIDDAAVSAGTRLTRSLTPS